MPNFLHPRPVAPKKAGGLALFFGDSLSDALISVGAAGTYQGVWADTLCAYYGWTRICSGTLATGGGIISASGSVATLGGGGIASISAPTTKGAGYIIAPAITFTGGTGAGGAAAHAVLGRNGRVESVVVDAAGVYTVAPTVVIAANPFAPAAATGTSFSGGAITGLTGITAGSGYPSYGAAATYAGGGGTGAFENNLATTVSGAWYGITGIGTSRAGGTGYISSSSVTIQPSNNHARAGVASTTLQHMTNAGIGDCGIDTYPLRCTTPNADVVFVWYVTNDYTVTSNSAPTFLPAGASAPFSPLNYKASLDTVVAAIRAQASAPLIVMLGIGPNQALYTATTYPTGIDGQALGSANAVLAEYNRAIAEVAAKYGAVFVSLQSLSTAIHTIDGVHLTSLGATYVAELVKAALG